MFAYRPSHFSGPACKRLSLMLDTMLSCYVCVCICIMIYFLRQDHATWLWLTLDWQPSYLGLPTTGLPRCAWPLTSLLFPECSAFLELFLQSPCNHVEATVLELDSPSDRMYVRRMSRAGGGPAHRYPPVSLCLETAPHPVSMMEN